MVNSTASTVYTSTTGISTHAFSKPLGGGGGRGWGDAQHARRPKREGDCCGWCVCDAREPTKHTGCAHPVHACTPVRLPCAAAPRAPPATNKQTHCGCAKPTQKGPPKIQAAHGRLSIPNHAPNRAPKRAQCLVRGHPVARAGRARRHGGNGFGLTVSRVSRQICPKKETTLPAGNPQRESGAMLQ